MIAPKKLWEIHFALLNNGCSSEKCVYLPLTTVNVSIRTNTESSCTSSGFMIVSGMRKQESNTKLNQNSNEKTAGMN